MVDELVIAIDPGREKCGVAVVHRIHGVLGQQLVKTSEAARKVTELAGTYAPCKIILGDSTYSKNLKRQLEEIQQPERKIEIILVNEYRSTDEGRKRYWSSNPPKGFRRFIPVTMQVPPVPIDDYAAIILAERYFNQESSRSLKNN